jgi:hypothetical protein
MFYTMSSHCGLNVSRITMKVQQTTISGTNRICPDLKDAIRKKTFPREVVAVTDLAELIPLAEYRIPLS